MNCKFCNKELNPRGLSHVKYCSLNPDRIVLNRKGENNPMFGKPGTNQYIHSKKQKYYINHWHNMPYDKLQSGATHVTQHRKTTSSNEFIKNYFNSTFGWFSFSWLRQKKMMRQNNLAAACQPCLWAWLS